MYDEFYFLCHTEIMSERRPVTHDTSAALLAWALTAVICILLLVQDYAGLLPVFLAAAGFVIFAILLLSVAGNPGPPTKKDHIFLGLEFITICSLYFVIPYDYIAILKVIWSAQMAWFIPLNRALILSPIWSSPFWLVSEFYWLKEDPWATAILFWTFNVFGIFMISMTRSEQTAKEQIERQKRELESAHFLLRETASLSERVRISRDIHDMVGHQLTALTMNIQATEKHCLRELSSIPEPVKQSRILARQLLDDIRSTVREIRDDRSLNLQDAIGKLTSALPGVKFETEYKLTAPLQDIGKAETLLRFFQESVSNSLRHGQATHIRLSVRQTKGMLIGTTEDNGFGFPPGSKTGSGLKGLKERAESEGGQFTITESGIGVIAKIVLKDDQKKYP